MLGQFKNRIEFLSVENLYQPNRPKELNLCLVGSLYEWLAIRRGRGIKYATFLRTKSLKEKKKKKKMMSIYKAFF